MKKGKLSSTTVGIETWFSCPGVSVGNSLKAKNRAAA